jgi:L-threonylcarbamoyladenylate synthase
MNLKTKIIKISLTNPDKRIIRKIAKEILNGKIIVYPTETCYGLGGNALDRKVVEKIYEIKKEPTKSNILVIVPSLKIAEKYGIMNENAKRLVKKFMPGPLTLIVKRKKNFPKLTNKDFVFRISCCKVAHEIAKLAKVPITATSANLHGKPSIYSSKKVIKQFKGKVDIILDAGNLKGTRPSTIVDVRKEIKLVREGPIPFTKIFKFSKRKV